jgi:hypothetical protein
MHLLFALGIVTPWGGDLLARLRFRRLVVSEENQQSLKYSPPRACTGNAQSGKENI